MIRQEYAVWKCSVEQTNHVYYLDVPRLILMTDDVIPITNYYSELTLLWRTSLSYRNQSTDLLSKPMDCTLYHRDLRHKRVNGKSSW